MKKKKKEIKKTQIKSHLIDFFLLWSIGSTEFELQINLLSDLKKSELVQNMPGLG